MGLQTSARQLEFGRRFLLAAVVTGALSATCFAAQPAACNLPKGLWSQRVKLEERYRKVVGNNYSANQKVADEIHEEEHTIDRQYAYFMNDVGKTYSNQDHAAMDACCDPSADDPVVTQFCGFVRYRISSSKDTDAFVRSLPRTKEQLFAFWRLDEISAGGAREVPSTIGLIPVPNGLTETLINELFALVVKGDSKAAEEYALLYGGPGGSSGYLAEYLDDQIAELFLKHSDITLRSWPTFRKYKERLEGSVEMISPEESKAIAAKYRSLCKTGDNRCDEIVGIFQPKQE